MPAKYGTLGMALVTLGTIAARVLMIHFDLCHSKTIPAALNPSDSLGRALGG